MQKCYIKTDFFDENNIIDFDNSINNEMYVVGLLFNIKFSDVCKTFSDVCIISDRVLSSMACHIQAKDKQTIAPPPQDKMVCPYVTLHMFFPLKLADFDATNAILYVFGGKEFIPNAF